MQVEAAWDMNTNVPIKSEVIKGPVGRFSYVHVGPGIPSSKSLLAIITWQQIFPREGNTLDLTRRVCISHES